MHMYIYIYIYTCRMIDMYTHVQIVMIMSPRLPAMYVAGASHHAWTHPTLPTDQESVKATLHNRFRGGNIIRYDRFRYVIKFRYVILQVS